MIRAFIFGIWSSSDFGVRLSAFRPSFWDPSAGFVLVGLFSLFKSGRIVSQTILEMCTPLIFFCLNLGLPFSFSFSFGILCSYKHPPYSKSFLSHPSNSACGFAVSILRQCRYIHLTAKSNVKCQLSSGLSSLLYDVDIVVHHVYLYHIDLVSKSFGSRKRIAVAGCCIFALVAVLPSWARSA